MKQILILVMGVMIIVVGILLFHTTTQKLPPTLVQPTKQAIKPTITPSIAQPMTLTIPKLSLTSHIESVGLDPTRRMAVPEGVGDTGWYEYGPKPAEVGNAVIDGHFDTPTGAPSVFYYIGTLQEGDLVEVTDADTHTYTFVVNHGTSFPDNNFPIVEVFGPTKSKNLNLITCSGTWDVGAHNYSNRTVVFTTLKPQ